MVLALKGHVHYQFRTDESKAKDQLTPWIYLQKDPTSDSQTTEGAAEMETQKALGLQCIAQHVMEQDHCIDWTARMHSH